VLRRWVRELVSATSEADGADAIRALTIDENGTVSRSIEAETKAERQNASFASSASLASKRASFDIVRIPNDLYRHIAPANARVELLTLAARLARQAVEVHVPVNGDDSYRGRASVDLPRRALRALGARVAEPGDRFETGFVHCFFDDEPLLAEVDRAGLAVAERRGATFVLVPRGDRRPEDADTFAREVGRAARLLPAAERLRRSESPERAVRLMRERGGRARDGRERGPIGRARLRRAIGWLDALLPVAPNCYRRTLLEIALDRGAARETLVFGLDVGRTGHVAFRDSLPSERRFDVAFEIEGPRGEGSNQEGSGEASARDA
jgi:catechol 2,3-dioxygenase-like lactoylglutathione lyase family enzyme